MTDTAKDGGKDRAGQEVKSSKGRSSVLVLLALVLPALAMLLLLGNWQLQRLQWKEGLIATIETRMKQKPVALEEIVAIWEQTGDVDYLPVSIEGTFLHDNEQHFLATHDGQSGWYVYTPLLLPDGRVIIINRGFVPYDMKDAANRSWTPIAGAVAIVGLARNPLAEKPGDLVPDNTPGDRTWYWKDFAAMAQAMGLQETDLVPFFVDVSTTNGEVSAGPVGSVTRVSLPNNHLQYAFTWFGLAAALIIVAGFYMWRAIRRR
ncbi:MAG: SURF1 family protein [Hyphomicrobiales bacterium]|nr:SURF1 family protein [Hyphomicrobiales bacterium]MCP5001801.1 SURF1 family protein [Hyphomicrobiales bacterium]